MFTLSITSCGTVDTARSQHETKADAYNALHRFARGYDVHGLARDAGSLTTKCGRVNQASYTWNIRYVQTHCPVCGVFLTPANKLQIAAGGQVCFHR